MRSNRWGLALGFLGRGALVQAVDTITVKVPTGTCAPGAYTGSFTNGGAGAGSGVPSGPPKIVSGVDSSYGSYALQGCYDASSQGYVITGATTSSSMTLEYCASYCKGTPYFAIENGNTCICGSVGPSGSGVDIGEYGCMTSCTGNGAQCGGSPRYGIVYHCPTCTSGSGGSTVVVFSTTDSKGSTYLTSTTSALLSTSVVVYSTTDSKGSSYLTSTTSTLPVPSSSSTIIVYTTTDSKGSSYLTSSTSAVAIPSSSTTTIVYSTTDSLGSSYLTSKTSIIPVTTPSTSVIIISTTDSKGSSYVTSTTSTIPPQSTPTTPIVVVVTATQSVITTDSHGSTVTSLSTVVTSSTTTSVVSTNSANPSGKPSSCPGAGGPYTDDAGQTYQIYCGTDIPYNDLIAPHVDTFPECLAACDSYIPDNNVANGKPCVAISFGYGNPGGNCYLKYAIGTYNIGDTRFDCARMIGYNPTNPTTTSLGIPVGSSQSSSSIIPQGTTTSSGPQTSPQATITPAGPQTSPKATTSPAGTLGYSSPVGGQSSPAVFGSSTTSSSGPQTSPASAGTASSVTPSQSAFPCPSYDGIAYIDTMGDAYQIECSTDYPYYNLPGTQHYDTFQACILACDNYIPSSSVVSGASCVAVTWGQTNPGGNCYLKYQINGTNYGVNGLDSAYRANYTKIAASGLSTPTTPASSPTSTPAGPTGTTSTSATSSPAGYVPASSNTPTTSKTTSSTTTTPAGYVNPATSSTSTPAGNVIPTSTTTSSKLPTSTGEFVCPGGVASQYTNRYGTTYNVQCGFNPTGQNGRAAHADTFSECLEFCDILHGCAAVTWIGARAANISNCYPYASITGAYTTAPQSVYCGTPSAGPTNDDVGQSKLCPAFDGKPYTDIFGTTYNVACGQNATGNALWNTQTNTLSGCAVHCSSYSTCVGVTFLGTEGGVLPDSQTPNCFPISSHGPTVPQANCSYAVLPS